MKKACFIDNLGIFDPANNLDCAANWLSNILLFKPPLEMSIKPGLYKHFKGSTYRVIGIGKHSETLEEMVIYVSPKSDTDYWVRPLYMFDEVVEHEGKSCKRFTFIE